MADLSGLSVEELLALRQQQAAPAPTPLPGDLSSLSTDELLALRQSSRNQDWNLMGSIRNFGSGVLEGAAGGVALVADLNPFSASFTNRMASYINPYMRRDEINMFPASSAVEELADSLLAEEDPQYRYARTLGNFAAPVPIKGANTVKNTIASLVAGLFGQAAEDATGDTKIAPIVGAITGGGAVSAADDTLGVARRLIKGASPEEITGSAAKAFRDQTGLTTDQLAAANMGPRNLLEDLQTTAERTGNAGVAQLEKTLGNTGTNADIYAKLAEARNAAREGVLSAASPVTSVNREALDSALIETADAVQSKVKNNAAAFWDEVPRYTPIDVGAEQGAIADILASRQGGLQPGSKVRQLLDQFLDSPMQTSGKLQDIRSDALALSRAENLAPVEERLLTAMQSGIDNAMARGLEGREYDTWRAARQATASQAETFGRGTAGGYLTSDNARISSVLEKVFKGDRRSVVELRAAIGESPELLQQVQRGVLDMIPRDAAGNLTQAKMGKFLEANETGLKELFGDAQYAYLNRIYEDLRSQASVKDLAFKASEGNSVTSQRNTVAGALADVLSEASIPGASGIWAKLLGAIKEGAGLRDRKAVEDLVFRAALDPVFAEQLSQAPTRERIFDALETLANATANAGEISSIVAAKELSREQDNRTPLARALNGGAPAVSGARQGSSGQRRTGAPTQAPAVAVPTPQQRTIGQGVGSRGSLIGASLQPTGLNSDTQASSTDPIDALAAELLSPNRERSLASDLFSTADLRGDNVDAETFSQFTTKVSEIADELGADPSDLMAVMRFETGGTLNPAEKNRAGSGATGLIQFMPSTAQQLTGAETREAAIKLMESMSPVEQLDYVKKYLAPFKGRLKSLDDVYMAVLWPRAVGKDPDYALFEKGTRAYWQNRGLDLDKDGTITKEEAVSKVRRFNERNPMVKA